MSPSDIPRIDFYVLESSAANGWLNFICRLTEKAYGTLGEIYAHTNSATVAQQLDEMLWTFRQGSFVPHEVLNGEPPRAPVRIGTADHCLESGDLLINLTGEVPSFAKQFSRIAEVVDADPARRAAGRTLFRQYREMGLKPVTHNI